MKRGNIGFPMYTGVGRFTGVVPLLYCEDAFEVHGECGLQLSLVVFRMARPHNTHTCPYTDSPFVAV